MADDLGAVGFLLDLTTDKVAMLTATTTTTMSKCFIDQSSRLSSLAR
jgi:hypothetical protein